MAGVRVYTTRWCEHCSRAKALLDAKGVDYDEVPLDDNPSFRKTLLRLTGRTTVPQILLGGSPIGGYTELWWLERLGRLDQLLEAANGDGWHEGQYQVPRPATRIRSIGVPQRSQGSPARP
jgi:glutaredoxin 3